MAAALMCGMRKLLVVFCLGVIAGIGAIVASRFVNLRPPSVAEPALVLRMREVARLETLDLTLYRKIDFAPDPKSAPGLWSELATWVRYSVHPPQGKVIVFAEAHVGIDLARLGAQGLRVQGGTIYMVSPPLRVTIELRPAETEVIASSLDSAETAELLEKARAAFQHDVEQDVLVMQKARGAAERALTALVRELGYSELRLVEALPAA
jgi:hypothetical protein